MALRKISFSWWDLHIYLSYLVSHLKLEVVCIPSLLPHQTNMKYFLHNNKISPPNNLHLLRSPLILYLRPETVTAGSVSTGTSFPRDMSITCLHLHRTASPAGWNTITALSENSLYWKRNKRLRSCERTSHRRGLINNGYKVKPLTNIPSSSTTRKWWGSAMTAILHFSPAKLKKNTFSFSKTTTLRVLNSLYWLHFWGKETTAKQFYFLKQI